MGPERTPWEGGPYSAERVENSQGTSSVLGGSLNDLVPFETMCCLRCSPRVLDLVPMVKEAVRDYATLANIRLNELSSDPKMTAAFDTRHIVAAKADSAARVAADVTKYVTELTSSVSPPVPTFGSSDVKRTFKRQ
jgi:hypothetical protein